MRYPKGENVGVEKRPALSADYLSSFFFPDLSAAGKILRKDLRELAKNESQVAVGSGSEAKL